MNKALIAIPLQLAVIGAIPMTYFAYPVTFARLVTEDNWGEFTTFAALLVASVLFAICYRRGRGRKWAGWYLLLVISTFFVGMEEISWGQRLMGVETPEFLGRINLQDEITLHNVSWISPQSTTYAVVGAACIFFGFLLPLAITLFSRVRALVQRIDLPLPPLYLSPLFIAAGYFVGFSSLYKGAEIGECLLALSLSSMAADHTVSARGSPAGGSDTASRILFAVTAFLAIGVVAVHLLLPLLISDAYQSKSFAFFNGLISGRSEYALEFYISKGQRVGWSAIGVVAVLALMAVPFIVGPKEMGSGSPVTSQWRHISAVPFVLIGALVAGILLTNIADRRAYFQKKLYSIADTHFVPLGLHRQAMSLVEYLEATSEKSSGRLLMLRGFSLLNTGRPEDAVPVLRRALAIDLRAQADNGGTAVLDRIARIYDTLGDRDAALRYWRESLSLVRERLNHADSDADRTNLHIALAHTFEAMGDLNNAMQEYLRALDTTSSAEKMIEIEFGVRQLFRQCSVMNGNMSPESADRIKAILDTPRNQRQKLSLCK